MKNWTYYKDKDFWVWIDYCVTLLNNMSDNSDNVLTQSSGCPVDDNQNSITAGEYGPILL